MNKLASYVTTCKFIILMLPQEINSRIQTFVYAMSSAIQLIVLFRCKSLMRFHYGIYKTSGEKLTNCDTMTNPDFICVTFH